MSSYLDGELPAEAAGRLRAHLQRCPRCRRELREMEAVAALIAEWDPARTVADLSFGRQEKIAATLELRPEPARPGRLAVSAAAALLAAAVLAGWFTGTGLRDGLARSEALRNGIESFLPGIPALAESPEESFGSIYVQLLAQESSP